MCHAAAVQFPGNRLGNVKPLPASAPIRKKVSTPEFRPRLQRIRTLREIAVMTARPLEIRFQQRSASDLSIRKTECCAAPQEVCCGLLRSNHAESGIAEVFRIRKNAQGENVRL